MNFRKTQQRLTILSLIATMYVGFLSGQNYDSSQSTFWENVSFGGGVGINFGNGFFSGMLAPSAVY